jgi:hypothetical protein
VILRVAATLAIVLGVAILLAYLDEIGKAPWSRLAARHLREMKDRATEPARYDTVTLAWMQGLPRRRPVAEYSALERRGVLAEGYVQRIQRAADGDIHLDFAPARDSGGHLVPFVSAEIPPAWARGSERWRYPSLLGAFRPLVGGVTPWDAGPRRVRLRGWLMYDFPYEGQRSPIGFPQKLSWWEIHPVTGIELWDEHTGRFSEWAR